MNARSRYLHTVLTMTIHILYPIRTPRTHRLIRYTPIPPIGCSCVASLCNMTSRPSHAHAEAFTSAGLLCAYVSLSRLSRYSPAVIGS